MALFLNEQSIPHRERLGTVLHFFKVFDIHVNRLILVDEVRFRNSLVRRLHFSCLGFNAVLWSLESY